MKDARKSKETLSDEELMQAYQQGDEQAFDLIYQRHSRKVYGYLCRQLKDRILADDVFQATFLKIHQAKSQYNPAFPLSAWLFTVCRSTLVDTHRKRARLKEDSDPETLDRAAFPEKDEFPSLPDMSTLPENQRKVVELRYGSDLSFEEIAARLETSPANARKLLSRALQRLKVLVNPRGDKL